MAEINPLVFASEESQKRLGLVFERAAEWAPNTNIIILTPADFDEAIFNHDIDISSVYEARLDSGRFADYGLSQFDYMKGRSVINSVSTAIMRVTGDDVGVVFDYEMDSALGQRSLKQELEPYSAGIANFRDSNIFIAQDSEDDISVTNDTCIVTLLPQSAAQEFMDYTGLPEEFYKDMGISDNDLFYFKAAHEISGHCYSQDLAYEGGGDKIDLTLSVINTNQEYYADWNADFEALKGLEAGDIKAAHLPDVIEHYRAISTLYNGGYIGLAETNGDMHDHITNIDNLYVYNEHEEYNEYVYEHPESDVAQFAPQIINSAVAVALGLEQASVMHANAKEGLLNEQNTSIEDLVYMSSVDPNDLESIKASFDKIQNHGLQYTNDINPSVHYTVTKFLLEEGHFENLATNDPRMNAVIVEAASEYVTAIEQVTQNVEFIDEVAASLKDNLPKNNFLEAVENKFEQFKGAHVLTEEDLNAFVQMTNSANEGNTATAQNLDNKQTAQFQIGA